MFSYDDNNFGIESIYDLDKKARNLKKNDRIVMDVTGKFLNLGTKYDLIRSIANDFDWTL
jgi:hypothetical protein